MAAETASAMPVLPDVSVFQPLFHHVNHCRQCRLVDLVVCDLDGTLLGGTPDYGITPRGLEALQDAVDSGALIGIATGRTHEFVIQRVAEPVALAIGVEPHVLITDERDIFYYVDECYVPDSGWNAWAQQQEKGAFWKVYSLVTDMEEELRRVDPSWVLAEDDTMEKRGYVEIWSSRVDLARQITLLVSQRLPQVGLSYMVPVQNHKGIAIRHQVTGKGNVLRRVVLSLRLLPRRVLAIGDNLNDVSMLDGKLGFLCATVSNADGLVKKLVKAAQGYMATEPYADGVAQILARFGIAKGM